MATNEVNGESIRNLSINLGRSDGYCRQFENRHRTMEQAEPTPEPERRSDKTGHPVNAWYVVSREASVEHNFFRTLEAMPVAGGGVMLRDSWYENTRPALQTWYEADMAIEERVYMGDDGVRRPGYLLVRRPVAAAVPARRGRPGPGRQADLADVLADEVVEMLERLSGVLDESEDAVLERAVRFLTAYHLDHEKERRPCGQHGRL